MNKAKLVSGKPEVLEFILVMTNRCPFITALKWQKQVKSTPAAVCDLLRGWPNDNYLDELFSALSGDIDLWIGHSAIHGTPWVWPYFKDFIQRSEILARTKLAWLITPNSGQTHGHLATFSTPSPKTHRLYRLFKEPRRDIQ
jgi:hypothetical protein